MNALELADEIRNFYSNPNQPYFLIQIQTMLRTLHAENEALKDQNKLLKEIFSDVERLEELVKVMRFGKAEGNSVENIGKAREK